MESSEGAAHSISAQREREFPGKRKLIRDGYLKIFKKEANPPVTRTAVNNEEYGLLLDEKLEEEAGEWMVSRNPAELADCLEVISAECTARTIKYTPVSLTKIQESDKELIKAIRSVINNGVTDMDIFNGMFLSQIEKWSKTHDFKELARVLGIVYAAGQLSIPKATIPQLQSKQRDKYIKLRGFSKKVVLEPQEVV